jgi:probable HAF family extracellular repeat protein
MAARGDEKGAMRQLSFAGTWLTSALVVLARSGTSAIASTSVSCRPLPKEDRQAGAQVQEAMRDGSTPIEPRGKDRPMKQLKPLRRGPSRAGAIQVSDRPGIPCERLLNSVASTTPTYPEGARIMSKRLAALIAAAIVPALTFAAPAQARTPYPYRLIDLGTFGGPSSYPQLPAIPITSNGTVLGYADTPARDRDWPHCFACQDRFIQHAFAWRDGRLTDLGALPGSNSSGISELNGHGVGVGVSENGRTDPHTGGAAAVAVMFKNGKVISLGTLPGGATSAAADINGQGQVAGISSNGTPDPFPGVLFPNVFGTEIRGFVWRNGVMHDLGTLGGPDTLEYAQNNRGQIIGASYTSYTPNPSTGYPTVDPFLWQHGHMTDLGTLGGHSGVANWINNQGEVVGQSDLAGDNSALPFLWKNGHMRRLPTIGGGGGGANWISPRGDIAGEYFVPPYHTNFRGFLWRNGKMTDLPPVGGAAQALGNSVNDHGQVVGFETDTNWNDLIAVLWAGGHGYDLNTLVAPNSLQMVSADYINNRGDIFGHGVLPNGDQRVFLLIRNPRVPLPPAPAPARPLPAITGPPDRSISVRLALHAAHHGSTSVPSARH